MSKRFEDAQAFWDYLQPGRQVQCVYVSLDETGPLYHVRTKSDIDSTVTVRKWVGHPTKWVYSVWTFLDVFASYNRFVPKGWSRDAELLRDDAIKTNPFLEKFSDVVVYHNGEFLLCAETYTLRDACHRFSCLLQDSTGCTYTEAALEIKRSIRTKYVYWGFYHEGSGAKPTPEWVVTTEPHPTKKSYPVWYRDEQHPTHWCHIQSGTRSYYLYGTKIYEEDALQEESWGNALEYGKPIK